MKPCYSAPVFNKFPPIEHANFGPKKYFHNYLCIGNDKNLGIKYDFDPFLEKYAIAVLYTEVSIVANI